MKPIIDTEIFFALGMVAAVLALRRRFAMSLHVWMVAVSSALLLAFIYFTVENDSVAWQRIVALALALKCGALLVLLSEAVSRRVHERTEELADARRREVLHPVQRLCNHFGSGVFEAADPAVAGAVAPPQEGGGGSSDHG